MFPDTSWTLMAQASLHGDAHAQRALGTFYQLYQQPVIAYLRWKGFPETLVEDLAQDFFLKLFEASSLRRASAARGTFRGFLCGCLNHFIADHWKNHYRQKLGGGETALPMETPGLESEAAFSVPAVDAVQLDRAWAENILQQAMVRVETEWHAAGKGARFIVYRRYLPGAVAAPSIESAASQLGLRPESVRSDVFRLRQSVRHALRAAVAATVSSPDEIDAEVAYLGTVLRSPEGPGPEEVKNVCNAVPERSN
jgi:DNA-directed RNA polymerase specialized sigma24 family protein